MLKAFFLVTLRRFLGVCLRTNVCASWQHIEFKLFSY